jgi:hypothetical protein
MVSEEVNSLSSLSKCRTRRKAVFFPTPGSLENSFTASSISLEGKIIYLIITSKTTTEKYSKLFNE